MPLTKTSAIEFDGPIAFDAASEYRIETKLETRTPAPTPWQHLRVLADEAPRIELSGVPASSEMPVESPVLLRVSVADDYGLTKYGLYFRKPAAKGAPTTTPAAPTTKKLTPIRTPASSPSATSPRTKTVR